MKKMTEEEETNRKMICDEAITKASKIMVQETKFSTEERIKYHLAAYELLSSGSKDVWKWLDERFKQAMEQTILLIVYPSLDDKREAPLLRELTAMLSKYRLMTSWLCIFFEYLDRRFSFGDMKVSLKFVSHKYFQDLVITGLYPKFRAAAILLINQGRTGFYIDCDLLKNVLLVFMEFYTDKGVQCYEDFEMAMLEETATYYSQCAQNWLMCDSTDEYIRKVSWCLSQEKGRVADYMACGTEPKLMEVVKCQLLDNMMDKLIEKKKAEDCGVKTAFQEMLSQYGGLALNERSSESTVADWLSAYWQNQLG
ncbi:cullin-1-like [Mercurialis annua]|uniref:cullin-1-like n=1 Tax=Mercurialis annua TaxID=3986 RepID=UPI0021601906|nr:cullin-1-like [Mercurialis annua]